MIDLVSSYLDNGNAKMRTDLCLIAMEWSGAEEECLRIRNLTSEQLKGEYDDHLNAHANLHWAKGNTKGKQTK